MRLFGYRIQMLILDSLFVAERKASSQVGQSDLFLDRTLKKQNNSSVLRQNKNSSKEVFFKKC